ncbi:MAG: isocitrate lyase/phosphoenolpyruvate mutase family protein [Brevundimonas sp.]
MVAAPEKAARFRRAHEAASPGFVLGNVSSPGLARELQVLGFTAVGTSSAALAEDLGLVDGAPDLEALLANARGIAEAVELPVSADLENGRANDAAGLADVFRRAAQSGLAGASIEDAVAPDGDLFPLDQACRRLEIACAAARAACPGFVVTARTEVWCAAGPSLEATVRRLRAYEAAGADVLFAPGLPWDGLQTVLEAIKRPLNVLVGLGDAALIPELFQRGVKRVSLGAGLARAGRAAAARAAGAVLEAGR